MILEKYFLVIEGLILDKFKLIIVVVLFLVLLTVKVICLVYGVFVKSFKFFKLFFKFECLDFDIVEFVICLGELLGLFFFVKLIFFNVVLRFGSFLFI